jgi:hypothetical protein
MYWLSNKVIDFSSSSFIYIYITIKILVFHDNQNPNGPFYEKTQTDHRLGGNYKKNHPHYNEGSKINRAQWRQQKKNYWKNEWDSGRWK